MTEPANKKSASESFEGKEEITVTKTITPQLRNKSHPSPLSRNKKTSRKAESADEGVGEITHSKILKVIVEKVLIPKTPQSRKVTFDVPESDEKMRKRLLKSWTKLSTRQLFAAG